MFGIFPWNYSFLLQQNLGYFKDDNPEEVRIVLIVIGVIVGLAILARFIKHGTGVSLGGSKMRSAPVAQRNFTAFTMFRISSAYSLTREQSKLLEFVFRNDAVSDPERVMRNPGVLDRHFRKAYKYIERNSVTDEEAQQRLAALYSLRNLIEASSGPSGGNATPQLTENSPAILILGDDSHHVKVLISKGLNVITDMPRNALGTPLRVTRGAKVTLSFFTKGNKGYSLDGKITGTGNTIRGPGLKIAHSGKVKPLVKRLSRRKQVTMKCELFIVHVEPTGSGRKKTNKLIVDSRKFTGAVQDISIGGCAVKTNSPIQAGSRIKINLDFYNNYATSVLGQVLRINKSGYTGIVLHVKFLKVPRRAFNSINTLVYGFDQDKP